MILGTKNIEATERAYCKLLRYVSEFRDNTFVPNVRNKAKERTSKKRIAEQATAIASSAAAASVRVIGAAVVAKPATTTTSSAAAASNNKKLDDDQDSFDSDADENDGDSDQSDRFEENPDADVDRREEDQDEESENADVGFEELTLRSVVKNKDVVTIANRVHEVVGNDEELAQQMIEKELLELAHRRSARRSKIEAKKRAKLAHNRDQDDDDALCQEIHSLFENNDPEEPYDEEDPYSYNNNNNDTEPATVVIADPMDDE